MPPRSTLLLLVLASPVLADPAAKPKPVDHAADCEIVLKKALPVIEGLAGKPLTASDKEHFKKDCRTGLDKDPNEPTITCVLKAADTPAVKACFELAMKDYASRSKRTEAALQLNKLGKNAKVSFIETSQFPKGKSALLPAQACCAQPDHHCAVTKAWAKDPVWAALDFQIDEPNLFQYRYESDGTTFKATAIGDPDCTGKPITYTLEGKSTGGNPSVTLTEPPTK